MLGTMFYSQVHTFYLLSETTISEETISASACKVKQIIKCAVPAKFFFDNL